jgi:hypothetical protein
MSLRGAVEKLDNRARPTGWEGLDLSQLDLGRSLAALCSNYCVTNLSDIGIFWFLGGYDP